jgi:fibronectin-binding autotransporter adhesin
MATRSPSSLLRKLSLLATLAATLPATLQALTWDQVEFNTGGTWSTTNLAWEGASNLGWTQGADAVFTGFDAVRTVSLGENIQAGSLSVTAATGNFTIMLNSTAGGAKTLDVTNINLATSSIDLAVQLIGAHDLNLSSSAASTGAAGRLNVKTAMTYTGNTNLSGTAYLLLDGSVDNLLPTTTVVNMGTTNVVRFNKTGASSHQIAGLTSASSTNTSVQATSGAVALTISTNTGANLSYGGAMTGALSVTVTGLGSQTISGNGAKSYTGTTTVSGGTLILGSNLTGTTAVSVTGGTLQTSANVAFSLASLSMSGGNLNIRGTGTAGTLTAGNGLTTTGGTFNFDLGTASDQIIGTGTFSLTNTTFALNLGSGFNYNNSYTLLSGYTSGSSSNLTFTGYNTATHTASLSNTGVLSFTPVPEPGIMALAVGGLAALGLRRRRRQA